MRWSYALWIGAAVLVGIFIGAMRPSLGTTLSLGTLRTGQMSQTDIIFGAILVSFLVFITLRGDLTKWLGLVGV